MGGIPNTVLGLQFSKYLFSKVFITLFGVFFLKQITFYQYILIELMR